MSEAPPFWFGKPGLAAWIMSPFGAAYGAIVARRMQADARHISRLPVLCIGNFIVGGAGKTPTAIALLKIARGIGLNPGFLTRGYGGSISAPTIVDIKTHNAHDIGDEPLILGLYATTVVAADRAAGAQLLEEQGVDFILMDDGFQNPSLHKDYSLAVVDARRGLGNGFCIPAGPLRAPLKVQLAEASAMLLIGTSLAGTDLVRKAAKMAKPILLGSMVARRPEEFNEMKVLAFAGIADPEKFYSSLEEVGAEITVRRNFHDHHPFSKQDCYELLEEAKFSKLTLVTTEKDAVRLIRMGDAQQELRAACEVMYVDMEFENPKLAELMVRNTIKNAAAYRLKNNTTA